MTGRRYIAYGSNLNRAQMALRCPDAKVVGTGEIKDYELLFRGNRNGAVATVPVLIWEISPRDEFNLDRYEGYPRLYGKEMLEVELDGKREKMMAYTMTEGYAMGVPSEHYLATIRTGYQEAGFDEDVLMAGVEKSRERMKQEMEAENGGSTMEPATAALIARAAIAAGTNKKVWTGIASVLAALCLPVILAVMCYISIASGGTEHNRAAVHLAFDGGEAPDGMLRIIRLMSARCRKVLRSWMPY